MSTKISFTTHCPPQKNEFCDTRDTMDKYNIDLFLYQCRIDKFKHTWTNTSPLHIHLHYCYPGFAKILSTNSQPFGIPGSQLHPGMPV